MTPSIRTTYLALSKSGRIITSFDHADKARAFARRSKAQGVNVDLVEETTVRKPLRKSSGGSVSKIFEHRITGVSK